jgi:hypothetical protein
LEAVGRHVRSLVLEHAELDFPGNLERFLEEKGVEPPPALGPEWDEARDEGCESPQELRLLRAIRSNGVLPEPTKQHRVFDGDRILTRADFAYLARQPKVLIYVDGLKWHSEVRQRVLDNRITNRLQSLGYRALRFLGAQTQHEPERCVAEIRDACGL